MKKNLLLFLISLLISFQVIADPSGSFNPDSLKISADSSEILFNYQSGLIKLAGVAQMEVPKGYKFLDAAQSKYVLTTLWGNPEDESTIGLLFREDLHPLSDNGWAIEVTYSADGYIDDGDAKKLDYADLLEQMQEDAVASNKEREKYGFPTAELVGWAVPPFYDSENKKLHWAKEIKFAGSEANTLNYNIRILGRKGYLMLNAIGSMQILNEVQKDIDPILASVNFDKGYQYGDFNPEIDQIAAYGIGGLITGKLLAKTGFFVLLLKFWKVIMAGVVGAFYFIRKILTGKETPQEKEKETA